MKRIALALMLSIVMLNGCASMLEKGSYANAASRKKTLTKVYDCPFDTAYNAIINLLERRLRLGVSRKYTNADTIFSSYRSPFTTKGAYGYIFKLKKIDANHTEVTLKACGTWNTVSDDDMLDKYIPEELGYIERIK
jgi:hypothetical protein